LLEQKLQSILLCLFWRWGLANYLPGLASNVARITGKSHCHPATDDIFNKTSYQSILLDSKISKNGVLPLHKITLVVSTIRHWKAE
jgi:hypothetical protein